MKPINIVVNDHKIKGNTENSLLDQLDRAGIQTEYQCKSGMCGVCRCILLSGNIQYQQPPLASLNNNEILPCCAYPTNHIEVLFDYNLYRQF